MTAKTKDGKEVFRELKIYMPQLQIYGRGDFMWSGGAYPGWKNGMLRDTSLQPGQTKSETIEIGFPYEDVQKDGQKTRVVKAEELDVSVELWYLPTGGDPRECVEGKNKFLFNRELRSLSLKPRDSYIR